ncbi:hypothetical protein CTEN210_12462 [Chaetoceros tenuissimus]|uniref:Uncharacterized protein n=1 Tax=Chaetoceros tenuissimus TaxID=426638 RepID=A0AAD3D3A0_9STRA|nr:hypothetical protein CTEN210_12462 [Chaetoceros tenuissimus]
MLRSGHTTSSDSSVFSHNNEKYLDKKKFCLILMIKPDEALESFVAECNENCSEKVHRQCALVPDLYHITLFANKWLSYEEAMSISYRNPKSNKQTNDNENNETGETIDVPKLPVLSMNGLLDWTHCIALHTDAKLDEWITNIHSSFSWELNNILHLTLYRIRGRNKEKIEQFQRIQNAFQDANRNYFGVANGTKIVLKEMGARSVNLEAQPYIFKMSSETDKIKAEVEAARLEVVQAEKEISSIRLALRNLAVKAQAAQQAAAAEASKEESEDGQKDASEKPKDDEDEENSLKITATKVTGLPEAAEPKFQIQLSSPIEEQSLGLDSTVEFKGVDTTVATLTFKASDCDIPLGSSAVYDVKPLVDVDVANGGDLKVSTLEVAFVPDEEEKDDFQDAKSNVDDEEKSEEVATETEDTKDDAIPEETKETDAVTSEEDAEKSTETKEEETEEATATEDVKIESEEVKEESDEASSPEETTPVEESKDESQEEDEINDKEDSEEKQEETKKETSGKPLLPTCVATFRIEYKPSMKDEKDKLYEQLNQASKKKAAAVDKLRKSAAALNRAAPAPPKKDAKSIKGGFLNKKAKKKESFIIRWYNKTIGPNSLVRRVFPVAKNYIIFFGGVALMHFQGQQLALPPLV